MAKEWAKDFYNSLKWIKCRTAFLLDKLYICNRCGDYGDRVHHKIYLTPSDICNPDITLAWANLECLCQDCHNKEHHRGDYAATASGLAFDLTGQLVQALPPIKGDDDKKPQTGGQDTFHTQVAHIRGVW